MVPNEAHTPPPLDYSRMGRLCRSSENAHSEGRERIVSVQGAGLWRCELPAVISPFGVEQMP